MRTVEFRMAAGAYAGIGVTVPTPLRLVLQPDIVPSAVSFAGASSALTVNAGDVIVRDGITLTTSTADPTVLVLGGSLTLRNTTVEESDTSTQAGIRITAGTVDLGTLASPGGNTLKVVGDGMFIRNEAAGTVAALGNSFLVSSGYCWTDWTTLPQVLRSDPTLSASYGDLLNLVDSYGGAEMFQLLTTPDYLYTGTGDAKIVGPDQAIDQGENITSFNVYESLRVPANPTQVLEMYRLEHTDPNLFSSLFLIDDKNTITPKHVGLDYVEYEYENSYYAPETVFDYEARKDFITLADGQGYVLASRFTKFIETVKGMKEILVIVPVRSTPNGPVETQIFMVGAWTVDNQGHHEDIKKKSIRMFADTQIREHKNASQSATVWPDIEWGGFLSSPDNFRIEDMVYHALDAAASGLVRWSAGELFVTAPGTGSTDETIQRAVNAALPGDLIHVETGGYEESVNTTAPGVAVTLVAGYGSGRVNLSGALTLDANDAMAYTLAGPTAGSGYGQWVGYSGLHLNGASLAVTIDPAYTPPLEMVFTLLVGAVQGEFAGYANGSFHDVGGYRMLVNYRQQGPKGETGGVTLRYTLDQPPVAEAGGPYSITEGDGLQLNASGSTDPEDGSLGIASYQWDLNNDGIYGDVTGVSPWLSWETLRPYGPNDGPATYTIGLMVTDGVGAMSIDTATVEIGDRAPTLAMEALAFDEGNAGGVYLSDLRDPGNDLVTSYRIDWGDGNVEPYGGSPAWQSLPHTYVDGPGTPTIQVYLTNDDGTFLAGTLTINVANVNPALSDVLVTPASVSEGDSVTLHGTISDPGLEDSFTVHVDWGDGAGWLDYARPAGTTPFTVDHVYLNNNPPAAVSLEWVKVWVEDKDLGASSTLTTNALVYNVAPQITGLTLTPAVVSEGGTAALAGSFSDPGVQDTFTVTVSWGDGAAAETLTAVTYNPATKSGTFSGTHRYLDNPAGLAIGQYAVNVKIRDESPDADSVAAFATVRNIPPQAVDDVFAVTGAGLLSVPTATGVLHNDSDAMDAVMASLVQTAQHGTLNLLPDGSFTYLPGYDWTGSDSFTYRAFDGAEYSNLATVWLTDHSLNHAPTAISLDRCSVAENVAGAVVGTVTVTDPDVGDHHTLTVSDSRFEIVSSQLKLKSGVSLDHLTTPSVALTITARDSGGLEKAQSFTITVLGSNHAPINLKLSNNLINENAATGTVVGTLSATDVDAGERLTYTLLNSAGGRFRIVGNQLQVANGGLLDYEACAIHSVNVRVADRLGACCDRTFTVQLRNQTVTGVAKSYTAYAGQTLRVGSWGSSSPGLLVGAGSSAGRPLSVQLVAPPRVGVLKLNSSGSFTYTPPKAYNGNVTFTYRIFDGREWSRVLTATIYVKKRWAW